MFVLVSALPLRCNVCNLNITVQTLSLVLFVLMFCKLYVNSQLTDVFWGEFSICLWWDVINVFDQVIYLFHVKLRVCLLILTTILSNRLPYHECLESVLSLENILFKTDVYLQNKKMGYKQWKQSINKNLKSLNLLIHLCNRAMHPFRLRHLLEESAGFHDLCGLKEQGFRNIKWSFLIFSFSLMVLISLSLSTTCEVTHVECKAAFLLSLCCKEKQPFPPTFSFMLPLPLPGAAERSSPPPHCVIHYPPWAEKTNLLLCVTCKQSLHQTILH